MTGTAKGNSKTGSMTSRARIFTVKAEKNGSINLSKNSNNWSSQSIGKAEDPKCFLDEHEFSDRHVQQKAANT